VSESLRAYDRDAITVGGALEQRLSPRLSGSVGAAFERSLITQDGRRSDFRLLSLPMMLAWDATGGNVSPHRGLRLGANLVPVPWVQGAAELFARVRLMASAYVDLDPYLPDPIREPEPPADGQAPRDNVIAGRVALGRIIGADASAVPPDWRLYAGGADSVRGYPYQSIGPRTASNRPLGGDASLEAGLELRRRIGARWGIVAFTDAGSVSAGGLRELGGTKVGVGLGIRFHTVIGPLRADVAIPLDPYPGDAPAQLYLGLGEAF
jgi:translocation and assembly module TamA